MFGLFFHWGTNQAPAADLDPAQVREAIDGAVRYLKRVQKPDGSWDEWSSQEICGATSLCTLALLSSGLTKDDPAIAKALVYLRTLTPEQINRTYSVALRSMVLSMGDPVRDLMSIRQSVEWLENNQVKTGEQANIGGWSYQGNEAMPDNSNTQYAILALYEAERAGVAVKMETWKQAKAYLEGCQNSDGSWRYGYDEIKRGTGTMTSAGIASLIMINGAIGSEAAFVRDGVIFCCQPNDGRDDDRINKGIRWLTKNFTTSPGRWNYYYLYGIERVGRLSAIRFFGDHDWYREGTDTLLRRKGNIVDYWKGDTYSETYDHIATAFALLFLAKGRRPILVSKAQYGTGNDWSPHPNDLHHLTEFAERRWGFEMSWQVIDISAATVDDLLQTPVLFFSGKQSPLGDSPQEQKKIVDNLRGYLEGGGFIFAEANPEDESFDAGFRELMRRVFENESDGLLRPLEPDHPVWTAEIPVPVDQLRPMEGIDFGCRTSVVYLPPYRNLRSNDPPKPVPPSLSCLWELKRFRERENPYPASIQAQIDTALGIGLNVLAYATGRELRYKYEIPVKASRALTAKTPERGKIPIAMLDHQGSTNAAPRAIPKLLARIAAEKQIPIDVNATQISLDGDDIFNYPILFMHGRNAVELTDEQRKRLKLYIDRGGFLFINAICSSKPFLESIRRELTKTFPDQPLQKLLPDDPYLSDKFGGYEIKSVTLRSPQRVPGRRTEIVNTQIAPELEGIQTDGRWSLLLSPYDLSCALEEMGGSLQCKGFTKEDAFKLALNAILYAIEFQ
ncbi:MAG: DUF4159 domain-containing protein [Planctomycetaceae bacterium]|nr:DUF4159 domain-containing protein [Planctomycetaceae bacterium]